jgi:hypothetical protein
MDGNLVDRMLREPLGVIITRWQAFLPNLVTALVILLAGLLLAGLVRYVLYRLLKLVGLDRHSERVGLRDALGRGGVREPVSVILSRLMGWLTALVFLIIALSALRVPTVERVLERFLLFLPNLFVALGIVAIGWLLGNFLGRAALIAGVNAGVGSSRLLGNAVRGLVFFFSLTMAMEQLGIGRETVVGSFVVILGGVVLALAIAFGLGGRHLARRYLESRLGGEERDRDRDRFSHL